MNERKEQTSSIKYYEKIFFHFSQVTHTSLIVDEKNPEQEITLESTLPVPCASPFPQDCKIRVELKASNDPNGEQIQ